MKNNKVKYLSKTFNKLQLDQRITQSHKEETTKMLLIQPFLEALGFVTLDNLIHEYSVKSGSVDIAINKAKSAVMIPYPTRAIGDLAYGKDGNPGRLPGIATVDFLVPFAGGLPIRTQNGDLLGAIGISGATGDQDEECAQAALDAIKEDLK